MIRMPGNIPESAGADKFHGRKDIVMNNLSNEEIKEFHLNPLTDCETLLMLCIWNASPNLTVLQMQQKLKKYGKPYKPTTIYTILSNLEEKGYISRVKKGTSYYSAAITKDAFLRSYLDRIQEVFGVTISCDRQDESI